MPPKTKFTKQNIIDAAFNVVRKNGIDSLSARNIAKEMNASTGPIYSYLKSMKNLKEQIIQKAHLHIKEFETQKVTGLPGIDRGIGAVMFAKQEKHLWRCLMDERHSDIHTRLLEPKIQDIIKEMEAYSKGLSKKQLEDLLFSQMAFIRGLSYMVNHSFHKHPGSFVKTDKEIAKFVQQGLMAIWKGFMDLSVETGKDDISDSG
jgi:AcrR family transcriptional regulator